MEIEQLEVDVMEAMGEQFAKCSQSDAVCLYGPNDLRCELCPSNDSGAFMNIFCNVIIVMNGE